MTHLCSGKASADSKHMHFGPPTRDFPHSNSRARMASEACSFLRTASGRHIHIHCLLGSSGAALSSSPSSEGVVVASGIAAIPVAIFSAAYGMPASAKDSLRSALALFVRTGLAVSVSIVDLTPGSSFSFDTSLGEDVGEARLGSGAI